MSTTIQISDNVKSTLDRMKMMERETYNEVIERMIEDDLELNEKTKREVEEARKRIKAGKFITHKEAKRRLGL
jgi:predicted transcriptional regulator